MSHTDIAQMIIALETAALEQWNQGNPSGYLDLYAADITYFDPFFEKRLDGIEALRTYYEGARGQVQVDKYEMIDPVVAVTETMAVLSYNLVSEAGGKIWRWNCTEVYRLEAPGVWKIVHNHWSPVKPLQNG